MIASFERDLRGGKTRGGREGSRGFQAGMAIVDKIPERIIFL